LAVVCWVIPPAHCHSPRTHRFHLLGQSSLPLLVASVCCFVAPTCDLPPRPDSERGARCRPWPRRGAVWVRVAKVLAKSCDRGALSERKAGGPATSSETKHCRL